MLLLLVILVESFIIIIYYRYLLFNTTSRVGHPHHYFTVLFIIYYLPLFLPIMGSHGLPSIATNIGAAIRFHILFLGMLLFIISAYTGFITYNAG